MTGFVRHNRHKPVFASHQRLHEGILKNEKWFGDGQPILGKQFTAAKAEVRKTIVLKILYREAQRCEKDGHASLAYELGTLADKIFYCREGRRCGSLACTQCARAFQRAKSSAQMAAIEILAAERTDKLLVMANVVPLWISYKLDQLPDLDVRKLNRWLKDALARAGFKRVMLGSIDFSWEADRGIYQPHWHIALFTSNPKELQRRLKGIFPSQERGDRPVVASKTYSLGFLPYKDKAIKLPALLRNNRRGLPYLMLALDRTEPLELMILTGVRVSAQGGGFQFKKIQRSK